MYGNLSYATYNGQGNIILSTWDDVGNRVIKRIPHTSRLFIPSSRGSDISIYGEKLEQINFENSSKRWKWMEDNPQKKIYECLNPIQEFLLDEYYGKNSNLEEFNRFALRVAYLDIEVAVESEFPEPEKAAYPINMITIFDTQEKMFHTFSLGRAVITRPDVVFHYCPTEYLLLDSFLKFMDYRKFHVISGWNSYAFDIPYIYNRICGIAELGLERALELSPVRKPAREKTFTFGGKGNRSYTGLFIDGVAQLDYMLLYMKYVIPIEGEKPSYSLNNVCLDEVKEGKTEHE
ncbi:MAG: 3'-5' exonuclease, partial [Lentisphaerota bacterium]